MTGSSVTAEPAPKFAGTAGTPGDAELERLREFYRDRAELRRDLRKRAQAEIAQRQAEIRQDLREVFRFAKARSDRREFFRDHTRTVGIATLTEIGTVVRFLVSGERWIMDHGSRLSTVNISTFIRQHQPSKISLSRRVQRAWICRAPA
jgi:hypothetical protein